MGYMMQILAGEILLNPTSHKIIRQPVGETVYFHGHVNRHPTEYITTATC
jgi:hypothetical protein